MSKNKVIGIDVGGSTTKIVGFDLSSKTPSLLPPMFVKATDQITSIYGALGRFTFENGIALEDIASVTMTGVGASYVNEQIYSLDCEKIDEFSCIGHGGLYLSGLDEAIVVSMGTGTALIHAKKENGKIQNTYLGGTGVGGGTIVGLSRKMLGIDDITHLEKLCDGGDIDKVDLRIKHLSKRKSYENINNDLTASNFGNLSDLANKNDIALGLCNMVAETIGMLAVFAARSYKIKDVVLTGNLTTISTIRESILSFNPIFDINFMVPDMAQYGTVIGAALNSKSLKND